MSSNILSIILILLIIGIIVYFYYNYKNKSISRQVPKINPTISKKNKKIKKRVRFNTKPQIQHQTNNSIDVDSICYPSESCNESDMDKSETVICPSNLDRQDDLWDAQFGLPLVDEKSKRKSINKIKHEHDKYGKSLGKFNSYQMDKNTIIKTDTTIDPFKSENRHLLQGKSIGDIYDKQVSGPKAPPKKILRRSSSSVIYENESDMNGGVLNGTTLHGYDGSAGGFQSANFENEF
jgi:hypothetical protein